MGTKYSSVSVSGYNSSPPADDGSSTSANQVKWSTIKTKLPDPLKTALESINGNLATFANFGSRQVTASDTTLASDHMKTIEIASTVSASVTISLGDATTMADGYIVTIKNSSTITQTVGRATVGDTIDGAASNFSLPSGAAVTFKALSTNYQVTSDYKAASSVSTWTVTGTLTGPTGVWNTTGLGLGAATPATYGRLAVETPTTGYGVFAIRDSVSGTGGVQMAQYYGTVKVSYMDFVLTDGTGASEDGYLTWATITAGSLAEGMRLTSGTLNVVTGITENSARVFSRNSESTCGGAQTYSAANKIYTFVHGLSGIPDLTSVWLQCTTADLGYSVGDRVYIQGASTGTALSARLPSVNVAADATNVYVIFNNTPYICNKGTAENANITASRWDVHVRAWY